MQKSQPEENKVCEGKKGRGFTTSNCPIGLLAVSLSS